MSRRLDYGAGHYQTARALLASFPNSALYRLDADLFFESLLPAFRWWESGRRYPSCERWLAFAYLDGPHDDADVARHALACLPRLAVGGRLCIDDARRCRSAVALLEAVPGLEREELSERRACFVWRGDPMEAT